jgi:hypothetical protein
VPIAEEGADEVVRPSLEIEWLAHSAACHARERVGGLGDEEPCPAGDDYDSNVCAPAPF